MLCFYNNHTYIELFLLAEIFLLPGSHLGFMATRALWNGDVPSATEASESSAPATREISTPSGMGLEQENKYCSVRSCPICITSTSLYRNGLLGIYVNKRFLCHNMSFQKQAALRQNYIIAHHCSGQLDWPGEAEM